MTTKNGKKDYFQLLLDPNRSKLLTLIAVKRGVRTTSSIRDIVYKEMERTLPSWLYQEALAKDEALWRQSVRNRVEGKIAAKIRGILI